MYIPSWPPAQLDFTLMPPAQPACPVPIPMPLAPVTPPHVFYQVSLVMHQWHHPILQPRLSTSRGALMPLYFQAPHRLTLMAIPSILASVPPSMQLHKAVFDEDSEMAKPTNSLVGTLEAAPCHHQLHHAFDSRPCKFASDHQ